jgi:hypothetical protein
MGVFTVGRQVALEIPMPGWWLSGAAVDLDFRNGRYFDSSTANPQVATNFLSCSRASIGYAKNSNGALTQFASNALRITDLGLLVEDARTNICQFSQDITQAAVWGSILNATPTGDTTVAPDGTTTGDSIISTASAGEHYVRQAIGTALASGLATWSVYLKPNGYNYGIILAYDPTAGNYVYANFDLVNAVTSGTSTGGTPTGVVTRAEAMANGWVRCSVTMNTTANAPIIGLQLSNSVTTTPSFTADGVSGMYAWGAQVEQGAFPSSYIPTTGAAATRAAENITTAGSLQTAINAATGSLVAQTDNGGGAGFAANIVDSNGTNLLGFNSSNNALASMVGTLATANTANRITQDKLGIAWSGAGRSLVLNGGTVATDANAQTPSATQHIGSSGTATFAYAYVERLTSWNTKLADATLQGFTR